MKRIFHTLGVREEGPSEAMMAWDRPLLPEDVSRSTVWRRDPSMRAKLKFERRMCNRTGVFVAY